MSIPVAGSTAGTGFTYRRYVRHGATGPMAGWAVAVSGVFSTVALGTLTGAGALADGSTLAAAAGVVTLVAAALPVVAILLALGVPTARRRLEHLAVWTLPRVTRFTGRPRLNPRETVADTARQLSAYRVHWCHGVAAISYAALNWLLDALCLWTVLQAFGVSLPFRSLSLVYAAVVASAAVGLTPAGIGTVETAIVLALAGLGRGTAHALAAAVVYRAISTWLVLSIGWVLLAVDRRQLHRDAQAGGSASRGLHVRTADPRLIGSIAP